MWEGFRQSTIFFKFTEELEDLVCELNNRTHVNAARTYDYAQLQFFLGYCTVLHSKFLNTIWTHSDSVVVPRWQPVLLTVTLATQSETIEATYID